AKSVISLVLLEPGAALDPLVSLRVREDTAALLIPGLALAIPPVAPLPLRCPADRARRGERAYPAVGAAQERVEPAHRLWPFFHSSMAFRSSSIARAFSRSSRMRLASALARAASAIAALRAVSRSSFWRFSRRDSGFLSFAIILRLPLSAACYCCDFLCVPG